MTTRRRKLLELLRRASEELPRQEKGRPSVDEAAIWTAHQAAEGSAADAEAIAERIGAAVARQRSTLEATLAAAAELEGSLAEVQRGRARVHEVLERLALLAINAGLEGARENDPAGRALLLVADEVRACVKRGEEASRELAGAAERIAASLSDQRRDLERARGGWNEVGDDAAALRAHAGATARSLEDMAGRLRQLTGLDPEIARAIDLASEHARGLLGALSTLSTAAPGQIAAGALRPVAAPLVRLLAELDTPPSDEES